MFNKFDAPFTNDSFFSVVIMSYTRPGYLKNLLESIHEHADMPFEIIVHDDASGGEVEAEIFNTCRGLMSTFILGSPLAINMGLAASANRAIALANSDYILFLNDDTKIVKPPFQALKQVLDVPYVGSFGPWQCANKKKPGAIKPATQTNIPVSANGIDFHIGPLANGAGIFSFKKERWVEVGGFPQVYTNAGDTCFMISLLKHGYFNASAYINREEMFTNVDQLAGYEDPTAGKTPFDASYPQIFGVDIDTFVKANHLRRHNMQNYSHHQYYCEEGIVNHTWWDELFQKARTGVDHGYDWNVFKPYGQDQWKDLVEEHLAAWRAKKED